MPAVIVSTNDARAGKSIVKAAAVAAEERREQTETSRRGKEEPQRLAHERVADVERRVGFTRDDANTCRHLAERLAAGSERDEIAAILHEQKRHHRPGGKGRE